MVTSHSGGLQGLVDAVLETLELLTRVTTIYPKSLLINSRTRLNQRPLHLVLKQVNMRENGRMKRPGRVLMIPKRHWGSQLGLRLLLDAQITGNLQQLRTKRGCGGSLERRGCLPVHVAMDSSLGLLIWFKAGSCKFQFRVLAANTDTSHEVQSIHLWSSLRLWKSWVKGFWLAMTLAAHTRRPSRQVH